jgi:hypothetical protein
MSCWRRLEKISWTDRVRNEKVLHGMKEKRNILHTIKRRKANWIGHIWSRNCFVKHIFEERIEAMIEVTGKQGRRRKQLLDDHTKEIGCLKLKEETLYCTRWRTRCGIGCGPVVRQTGVNELMN